MNVVKAMYAAFDQNGESLPVTREMKEQFKTIDFSPWEEIKSRVIPPPAA